MRESTGRAIAMRKMLGFTQDGQKLYEEAGEKLGREVGWETRKKVTLTFGFSTLTIQIHSATLNLNKPKLLEKWVGL